jgi:uncharacterized protein
MQVVRKSSFAAVPWKNGGGITHEVIRVPAHGNSFRWRVSVAEIETSGPFSDFADYDRRMVLLRGSGVRLTFDGARQTYLRDIGDLAEFDGALKTECELLGGPCTDLNLMVSKSMKGARTWVERLREPRSLSAPQDGTALVFAISGALLVYSESREPTRLDPWDLAVISPGDISALSSPKTGESEAPLVFFATLDDNSPNSF